MHGSDASTVERQKVPLLVPPALLQLNEFDWQSQRCDDFKLPGGTEMSTYGLITALYLESREKKRGCTSVLSPFKPQRLKPAAVLPYI